MHLAHWIRMEIFFLIDVENSNKYIQAQFKVKRIHTETVNNDHIICKIGSNYGDHG